VQLDCKGSIGWLFRYLQVIWHDLGIFQVLKSLRCNITSNVYALQVARDTLQSSQEVIWCVLCNTGEDVVGERGLGLAPAAP
jgi:hypothetical protein